MTLFELEEIPEDTDDGHPAWTNCCICNYPCTPMYRDQVGELRGVPTYDFFCGGCGKAQMDNA